MPRQGLIVAPSVLSADFFDMAAGIALIEKAHAPWIHLDVMDGQFVPNLTFGPKMIADIRKRTTAILDVHLMINEPERSIDQYIDAGADYLTFHAEACVHSHRLLAHIRSRGIKAGISLVPGTPVQHLQELLPELDLVLVMSVNPGFGGQKLIHRTLSKVAALVEFRENNQYSYLVSIDGGVNNETAPAVLQAKPDVIVAGNAFFASENPEVFIKNMVALGNEFGIGHHRPNI